MTPERMAAGRTEYLTRELKLDDRQAKKVYKIYLKQAEKLLGGMEFRSFGEMGGGRRCLRPRSRRRSWPSGTGK